MSNFRVLATCQDASGAPISVTWYGNACNLNDAVQRMAHEAQNNGWSVGAVICVQQRKSTKSVEVCHV
ncbi:TPA: hypothetical protein LLT04_005640 [Klebsiella michiganensis]|uniref:Uncharacterized protein n=1 Tax=Klebsiella michiganensis TaxID=1134687 RepID=A0AB35Q515_9ENTR|nr:MULTISPECIES: hypothetical protein [Klebsiella/Raoultella group]MBD0922049.1 hypothetical protein [Klebsiella michiganensis]MBD0959873.1 hypothetical protein [Klebsiella michiganensis]MBG2589770.1 hypothetical protein [Klebsiella michiganensis]MBG2640183.1 hypothetical protein [Klebsiella michiganensis]MBG2680856.1 hypothetical protein [Klebsiella michiganensis]